MSVWKNIKEMFVSKDKLIDQFRETISEDTVTVVLPEVVELPPVKKQRKVRTKKT